MPIFEFCCCGCQTRFEKLVRGSEAVACPACGGRDLRKLISAFAFGVKGAGGQSESFSSSAGSSCSGCSSSTCSGCSR